MGIDVHTIFKEILLEEGMNEFIFSTLVGRDIDGMAHGETWGRLTKPGASALEFSRDASPYREIPDKPKV
jgi:hypothetical protein